MHGSWKNQVQLNQVVNNIVGLPLNRSLLSSGMQDMVGCALS
jgi:hypothetical protein